ncbi:MAG: hypothetical protein JXR63_03810 [Spirochaetales bacterium]|nr:hypothetical protein [Spirochaetales bacterium]
MVRKNKKMLWLLFITLNSCYIQNNIYQLEFDFPPANYKNIELTISGKSGMKEISQEYNSSSFIENELIFAHKGMTIQQLTANFNYNKESNKYITLKAKNINNKFSFTEGNSYTIIDLNTEATLKDMKKNNVVAFKAKKGLFHNIETAFFIDEINSPFSAKSFDSEDSYNRQKTINSFNEEDCYIFISFRNLGNDINSSKKIFTNIETTELYTESLFSEKDNFIKSNQQFYLIKENQLFKIIIESAKVEKIIDLPSNSIYAFTENNKLFFFSNPEIFSENLFFSIDVINKKLEIVNDKRLMKEKETIFAGKYFFNKKAPDYIYSLSTGNKITNILHRTIFSNAQYYEEKQKIFSYEVVSRKITFYEILINEDSYSIKEIESLENFNLLFFSADLFPYIIGNMKQISIIQLSTDENDITTMRTFPDVLSGDAYKVFKNENLLGVVSWNNKVLNILKIEKDSVNKIRSHSGDFTGSDMDSKISYIYIFPQEDKTTLILGKKIWRIEEEKPYFFASDYKALQRLSIEEIR